MPQLEFIDKILPGNYWLTKSMEFVKINSSGTLWYLKKWIVYYYFIFFKDTLYESDYIEISKIFTDFINSLEPSVKDEAKKFFFEIDIKSNDFIKIDDFMNTSIHFANEKEHNVFLLNAKKFYFSYIMNIGGQAGYKKFIKDAIVSEKSYEATLKLLKDKLIEDDKLNKYNGLVNDFHAVLRNERQIFFYYGFFHGKESLDLSGFYSLTNIGKTIIKANFSELIILWEHQKIRMISQSPVVDMQNLKKQSDVNYSNFSILNHPYFTLLSILNKKKTLTTTQYQYVVSRINNNTDIEYVLNNIIDNDSKKESCRDKIESFGRKSDLNSEDFLKEIKKFILGICDLPLDDNSNFFQFMSWVSNNEISVTNQEKADFVIKNYEILTKYLDYKNRINYENFELELKKKYLELINDGNAEIDDSVRYEWYKYIINYDRNLYLNLIYISISLKENNYNYDITNNVLMNYYETYKFILTSFGIKKKDFKNIIVDIQFKLQDDSFFELEEAEDYSYVDPKLFIEEVNENKLSEISLQSITENDANTQITRKRNGVLINSMRAFYLRNYSNSDSKLIKCDCCESVTFITNNNYAYLEFHHLIPFSTDSGPDHYLNLFGICPNCHRKLHYLQKIEKPSLYENLSDNNNMQKTIIFRINKLFNEKALEPIHLDFLKKEKIINHEQYDRLINNLEIINIT